MTIGLDMAHKKVRAKLRTKQNGKCCYCGKQMIKHPHIIGKALPNDAETVEHLKRPNNGGLNALDNIALACLECNAGRGVMDWFTYKSYRMGEIWS